MKRIVHVITTLDKGGAENQLAVLIREQISKGYEVNVIPLKGNNELESDLFRIGAKITDIVRNRLLPMQLIQLQKLLNFNVNIVHAHLPRAELLASLATALKKNRKLVLTRHNSEPFFPSAPRIISIMLSRFVTRISKNVIFISQAVSNYCLSNHEISPRANTNVVLYGYLSDECGIEANELDRYEKLIELKQRNLLIGTVARLEKQKDLKTLVDAFAISKLSHSEIMLIIVGSGRLKSELEKYVESKSLDDSVLFYGRSHCVTRIMKEFDFFVLSSIYEGFGMVLLEAASVGVPIIAANNSAIPEVTGEKYEGLFETSNSTNLSSLLNTYLDSPSKTLELTKVMEKRLELFDAKLMEKKIDLIYENLRK